MDVQLPPEVLAFRESVRDFARREIAPLVDEAEAAERTPRDLFNTAGAAGFLGVRYPEEFGGQNASVLAEAIQREEFGYVCSGLASALSVSSHLGTYPVYEFGTDEHRERYLVPALKGEKVSAFGLTEPNAGSDVRAIKTRAVKTGDGWVLNGTKTFITNGTIADFVVIVAYTDLDAGIDGIGFFVVDTDVEGMAISRLKKMGNLASEIAEISMQDVAVPAEASLGERGGFKRAMRNLNIGRVLVGAGALGVAQAALDSAVEYAKDREAFGKTIGSYQGVAFPLAKVRAQIDAARLAVYRAATMWDRGEDPVMETSIAKYLAAEAGVDATDACMRVFGGYGYMREYPIERYYRDARYFPIVEGTQEIHLRVIARQLGLKP